MPSIQKLSVIHAMILIAAIAPGLAMTRGLPAYLVISERNTIFDNIRPGPGGISGGGPAMNNTGMNFTTLGRPIQSRSSYWLGHIPYWMAPCLASLSIAMAGLMIFRPRPRPNPLISSPGSATGAAVAVALVLHAIRCLRFAFVGGGRTISQFWNAHDDFSTYFWIGLPTLAGCTVGVWWLALAFGGGWLKEPGIEGRLGRVFGWCWIAMAISIEVGYWCFGLNY